MPAVGNEAPDFRLPDQHDKETSLKQFRGKWVVLYFYPKDNTPGCTIEAIEFTKHLKSFEKLGAVILGASPDSVECHKNFIDDQKLKITLISDHQHKLLEAYGVWQLKKLYGREHMGVVRSTFLIDPYGTIAEVWSPVKVEGHVEAVLNKLQSIV